MEETSRSLLVSSISGGFALISATVFVDHTITPVAYFNTPALNLTHDPMNSWAEPSQGIG
jgi:hypothetical protein